MSESLTNLSPQEIKKRIEREKARRSLIDFTRYTKSDYEVNWHHRKLARALERFANKDIKRLIVELPPRHGKSELVSRRLPAFIFGNNPNASIIATSYSGDLASSMSVDVQRIIDSFEYHDLFPDVTLYGSEFQPDIRKNTRFSRTNNKFEIVDYDGSYLSAGVGGGITGRGADFAIIDDPIKNRKDAESQTYRNSVFNWFTSTLYTRLEKDAGILITLTRWHEDDLVGRLLKLQEEDEHADKWEVIRFPAIYEYPNPNNLYKDPREFGEALWPAKYDSKRLQTIKSTIGSYEFNALYQQQPSPPQGAVIQRKWFQYYKKLPNKFDEIIQSWDMTFKDKRGSDFVVGQVWGRIGADKYLIDQVRGRMNFTDTTNAVISLSAKHPRARAKLIEDTANGPAVISTLKRKISGLIPITPQGTKQERAFAVTPDLEAGNVYIPDPSIAPWVHDFVEECASFPNGQNDDQVDTMTQALFRLMNSGRSGGVKASIY